MEWVGLMGRRWGKADFQALKDLEERLAKLEQVDFDRFCREAAADIAGRLLEKVKKRTPVGVVPKDIYDNKKSTVTVIGASGKKRKFASRESAIYQQYWAGYTGGTLRDAWVILPVEKVGNTYIVTVVNATEYASYVEFGHRQRPGRYVPALGKSLKASWVKGRFMLTISEQELEAQLPALLEQKLYTLLKGVF
ncbi:HK97 gp10 family phage protein [Colidextribacter sp. OB.20]|uniref:HK97 gp10 family phage protein n=1 Tax=Colidextribacter sp. OB.20 TaxID=2304568 RepID=UPI00325FD32C